MERERVNILETEIDNLTLEDVLKKVEEFSSEGIPCYIVTPNVDHLTLKRKDREFEEAYKNASLIVPDGFLLLWASRFLGIPLRERIAGADLLVRISELASKKGYSIFLLGAEEEVSQRVAMALQNSYPELKIAGSYSPYFGFEKDRIENEKIVHLIRKCRPDILFTSFGSPKGEKWIYNHHKLLEVPISLNVGAGFDFISGRIKRASLWMQRNGLEWFWRLLKEPRRLWRRYLMRDMVFFYLILRQKFMGRQAL